MCKCTLQRSFLTIATPDIMGKPVERAALGSVALRL